MAKTLLGSLSVDDNQCNFNKYITNLLPLQSRSKLRVPQKMSSNISEIAYASLTS